MEVNSGPTIERLAPWVLVAVAVGGAWYMVDTAMSRQLSQLEGVLFQTISLGAGLLGSYIFGRQSARFAAQEIIKPHARSAFRRVLGLYQGLANLGQVIQESQVAHDQDETPQVLNTLQAMVKLQLVAAGYAMEDWRDIVPEEVADLEKKLGIESPSNRRSTK